MTLIAHRYTLLLSTHMPSRGRLIQSRCHLVAELPALVHISHRFVCMHAKNCPLPRMRDADYNLCGSAKFVSEMEGLQLGCTVI
jgi:hypothetical protein